MRTVGAGKHNHISDVAGIMVGNADDARLKSGVSVVTAEVPLAASVHVMGGATGTRETELLQPNALVAAVDAIVLAGGSAFGLDAASGVMAALAAAGRGLAFDEGKGRRVPQVPIVPAAILYDLANGGDKAWAENPYGKLGATAWQAAAAGGDLALGSVGAGAGAMAADCNGGLGSASLVLATEAGKNIVVAALVAVNPFGGLLCGDSQRFWAGEFELGDEFGGRGVAADPDPLAVVTKVRQGASSGGRVAASSGVGLGGEKTSPSNTVIGVVATNLALGKAELQRLAMMAQAGIARAVRPAHTPLDGDVLFAVSTGEMTGGKNEGDSGLDAAESLAMLGHGASLCVSRAIARGAYLAGG